MQDSNPSPTHLRTALFVDFDNIYLGLQREDPVAAEQFATDPTRWLTWLQDRLPHHLPQQDEEHRRRKILFRRCYLNPSQFGRFRPYFTRSAIEVVDCPPLTSGGKTSADIHMVMDILDTLSHPTRFDEFILLSGDADFTPVLLRLSKHDRRSAILAIGPASVAYKAACDLLIDQDTFLEEAIGATPNPTARAAAGPSNNSAMSDLLRGIADKISERASTSGELVATELPPIFREFSEFTSSNNWLGFNSLRNMTTAVVAMRRDLTMIDGDPWRVGLVAEGDEPAEPAAEASPDPGRALPAQRFLSVTDRNRLIEEILTHVRSVVDSSDSAVPMARAAQMVISRFGDQVLATRWAGAGTFRDLLEGRENPGFAISALKPGYIYDPARHQLPIDGRPEELVGDPQLNALAYRVHQLTDTPYLTRGDYARVFRLTAEEVNDHGYFLTRTSKSVRDRCIEEGSPIARASVNFILRGITFGGHRFGQNGSEEPLDLGACFFRNVVSLCDTAGIALDGDERETLSDWILGELRAEEGPSGLPRQGAGEHALPAVATVAAGSDPGADSES
jgi:hypothetical protein